MMDAKVRYHDGVVIRKFEALVDEELNNAIEGGIQRAKQFKENWTSVNINDVIAKFAPGSSLVYENGKIIFYSEDGKYSVVTDVGGGYLRIRDLTKNTKKPQYLNLDGSDGHNYVGTDGKIHGKSKEMYNSTTHFRIKKREEM